MSNLKNNPSEPVDINDIYLAVFHRLGIDNVESLRDPKNVEIEAIVADIEAKAKRRIADSPEIISQYSSSGKHQAYEDFRTAVRVKIGITEERTKDLDPDQIVKLIKDELLTQSSQDAKQWDKERMSYVQKIDHLERTTIPELKNSREGVEQDMRKRLWFMENLMGKELTHDHKIVLNAMIPIISENYEVKSASSDGGTTGFLIVNKDGTKVTSDNNISFLDSAEIMHRELERAGFLKQQNQTMQPVQRVNIVGVNPQNSASNNSPTQNTNARNNQSESQRNASEKNMRRINGMAGINPNRNQF